MDEVIRDGERRDLPERTFEFARRIVILCHSLDRRAGVGRTLSRQLLRAGCSVGANVQEGQGSQTRADFIAKFSVACKEAREAHYWLRLIAAAELLRPERLEEITNEANEIVAILTTIVKNAKSNSKTKKGSG